MKSQISNAKYISLGLAPLLVMISLSNASATMRYVDVNSAAPTPPYTSWATAAANIQDAIDAALAGDEIVVTNGLYATGGRPFTRVTVDKAMLVRSVNGPQFTVIEGHPGAGTPDAIRGASLVGGAILSGFTVTNGAAANQGGGVLCADNSAVVTNCVVVSNSAAGNFGSSGGVFAGVVNNCTLIGNGGNFYSGGGGGAAYATLNNCTLIGNRVMTVGGHVFGGGAYACTLNNCLLIGNRAGPAGRPVVPTGNGGGASDSILVNCTLVGNQTDDGQSGGGAYDCSSTNCIIYFNAPDNYAFGTNSYCCTTPQPSVGTANITTDPLFTDLAAGNLRLQSNSPCINAGNNNFVNGSTDLDGRPRIVGGMVDIGAYEYQPDIRGQFIGWLQQYGLPTDGSADYTDPDADGRNNWQEWRCQTNPTNGLSVLKMVSALRSGNDVVLTWQSVAGVNYLIERSTNLGAAPAFAPLAANIPGQGGTTSYLDLGAAGTSPLFYRVGVGH